MIKKIFFILGLWTASLWATAVLFAEDKAGETALAVGAGLDNVGVFIERAEGKQVNVRIVDRKFQFYFLDAEKKLMEPDATQVIVRYSSQVKKTDRERNIVLKPAANGLYLTASRAILPPFDYQLRIILKFADASATEFLPLTRLKQMGTSE